MGDFESSDRDVRDIDIMVAEARSRSPHLDIDDAKALPILQTKLLYGDGFYLWHNLEDAWFVRIPRTDLPDQEWLKRAVAEMVHICYPANFLLAVERQAPKDVTIKSVGYVARDGFSTKNQVVCSRCKTPCSEQNARRGKVLVKMNILSTRL